MADSNELGVGTAGRELADFFFTRQKKSVGLFMPHWYRTLTADLLPQPLAAAFELSPAEKDRRRCYRELAMLRRIYPHLPNRLRYVGPYFEATERLSGGRFPSLRTRVSNRVWLGQPRLGRRIKRGD